MNPLARKDKLTVRELPDETLVYDLERHKAHCLNRTSALVWKHCDGQTGVAELAQMLQRELRIPDSEAVVQLALEQLSRRHLLEQPVEPLSNEARISRREILKRLAITAVALPLAMTIAAPKAYAGVSTGDCTGQADNAPCGFAFGSGSVCCRGSCVSTSSFFTNTDCGSCGRACPQGQICVAGTCIGTPGG